MRAHSIGGLLIAGAAVVLGCQSKSADLEPAKDASVVPTLEDAAAAEMNRIGVVASAERWPGEAYITERLTPIRVTITNESDDEVHIRYRDFRLVGESGITYRVLPPLSVRGSVDVSTSPGPALFPGFDYEGFVVADPLGAAYPGVGVYEGTFDYDDFYHDAYYAYWDLEQNLPTPEMIAAALPEGVILPGGFVAGWLYFQKIDDDEESVSFEAMLHGPDEQDAAAIAIPFEHD